MTEVERTVMFTMPNQLSGQLACIGGSAAGRSWDLSAGTFTIGRLDEHDLCLVNEPGVSKTHAKIIGQGDRYVIVDCESRNGTLVNGVNVQKGDLYDGDEIRICGCVLRFAQPNGPTRPKPRAAPPTADKAMPASATATFQLPQPAAIAVEAAPIAAAVAPAVVVVAPPPATGRILATWYAAGLVSTLLVGGGASAWAVRQAPDAVAVAAPVPPVAPVTTPTPTAVADGAAPVPGTVPGAGPGAVPPADAATAAIAATADGAAPTSAPASAPTATAPPPEAPPPAPAPPEPTPAKTPEPAPRATNATAKTATRASSGNGQSFPAVVAAGAAEGVKTKTGGKVASVAVADGAVVTRGQTLVTFETGADPGELANLQDRIASLENAEDDEARRELKAAKQKLAALEGGKGAVPIVAPADGKLTGFSVAAGDILRPGEVVGRIGDAEAPTRVRVSIPRSLRVRSSEAVTLVLRDGSTADGSVVAVSGRTVVVSTGSVPAEDVAAVRF
jgi:hypothetical protein